MSAAAASWLAARAERRRTFCLPRSTGCAAGDRPDSNRRWTTVGWCPGQTIWLPSFRPEPLNGARRPAVAHEIARWPTLRDEFPLPAERGSGRGVPGKYAIVFRQCFQGFPLSPLVPRGERE